MSPGNNVAISHTADKRAKGKGERGTYCLVECRVHPRQSLERTFGVPRGDEADGARAQDADAHRVLVDLLEKLDAIARFHGHGFTGKWRGKEAG